MRETTKGKKSEENYNSTTTLFLIFQLMKISLDGNHKRFSPHTTQQKSSGWNTMGKHTTKGKFMTFCLLNLNDLSVNIAI